MNKVLFFMYGKNFCIPILKALQNEEIKSSKFYFFLSMCDHVLKKLFMALHHYLKPITNHPSHNTPLSSSPFSILQPLRMGMI